MDSMDRNAYYMYLLPSRLEETRGLPVTLFVNSNI